MKLIVATTNFHKAREIAAMLDHQVEVLTLKDIGFVGEIVENGKSFKENALIKLLGLFNWVKSKNELSAPVFLLADDSGLEVDFIKGAPGIMSARYAGESSNDRANIAKLLKVLDGVPGSKRTACFRCVFAAMKLDSSCSVESEPVLFNGVCDGKIGFRPKGKNGFGYDPIFFPEGFCRTFAELDGQEKNQISHRAHAVAKLKEWLRTLAF